MWDESLDLDMICEYFSYGNWKNERVTHHFKCYGISVVDIRMITLFTISNLEVAKKRPLSAIYEVTSLREARFSTSKDFTSSFHPTIHGGA